VKEARDRGIAAGLMQLITLWPFPRRLLEPHLGRVRAVLVPELNLGQMSREVKRVTQGLTRVETLNRIDGDLITPEEIVERLVKM
jgi:2-oxoglutarate ferredoxin oxidoreductase subunit alpha